MIDWIERKARNSDIFDFFLDAIRILFRIKVQRFRIKVQERRELSTTFNLQSFLGDFRNRIKLIFLSIQDIWKLSQHFLIQNIFHFKTFTSVVWKEWVQILQRNVKCERWEDHLVNDICSAFLFKFLFASDWLNWWFRWDFVSRAFRSNDLMRSMESRQTGAYENFFLADENEQTNMRL